MHQVNFSKIGMLRAMAQDALYGLPGGTNCCCRLVVFKFRELNASSENDMKTAILFLRVEVLIFPPYFDQLKWKETRQISTYMRNVTGYKHEILQFYQP
jgi:hypothetical protein